MHKEREKGKATTEKITLKTGTNLPKKQHRKNTAVRRGGGPPPWAPAHGYRAKQHVYFPDYYTYFDPRRNGYVYWGNNDWIFTPKLPSFLSGVDLGGARMQLLPLPLTSLPQLNFNDNARSFPARKVDIPIPIPPLPGIR